MAKDQSTWYCEKCNRTMNVDQFYQSNNLEKYPSRYLNQCKKCLTMHVDNWNPDSFLWILQDIDVPYIPDEWNKLLANYGRDKSKVTGVTILGRYLSKMKLKQFKEYRWKDTEFLQDLANHKIEEAMKRQGYDIQQITEAVEKASYTIPTGELQEPVYAEPAETFVASGQEDYFADINGGDDLVDELTAEDKLYLRLKWGKSYKPEEWVWLEKLYDEMTESYDIQSAGHVDTLKIVCKTSLKANQLLDIGDIDGAMKMIKMYDQLMKSGKFTAAQNKAENNDDVDSVGQIVSICERDGYIPRFYIDKPNDKVDRVIEDMQQYTHDLVTEELGLSNLIENAIKYSPKNPTIEVRTFNDTKNLIIEVQDNGIGIAPEHIKKIFNEFYRVPQGNLHDTKGFGLGLGYVKKIVSLHHGNITVKSKIDQGSTFIVSLPVKI